MSRPIAETTSTADALRAEMAPSGLLQNFLVGQIALAMDRLALAAAREDRDDPTNPTWVRYQAQAERAFYRALTEFRRLAKAEQKARADAEKLAQAPTPGLAPTKPAPAAVDARPRPAEKRFRFADALATPAGVGTSAVVPPRRPSIDVLDIAPARGVEIPKPAAARAG